MGDRADAVIRQLLSSALGAITGSPWVKALAAVLGIGQKVAEEVHDNNERVAGENKALAQGNAAAAKVDSDVAQAAVANSDAAALEQLHNASG